MSASTAEEWKGGDSYGEQRSYERKGGFGSIESAPQAWEWINNRSSKMAA